MSADINICGELIKVKCHLCQKQNGTPIKVKIENNTLPLTFLIDVVT